MIQEVWTGPVSAAQIGRAVLPGAELHFIQCTGDGHPTCGQMAEAWKGADGRVLPGLLEHAKITLGAGDELWAGAFSAGGQIWKRAMLQPEDRAQITGALMADAGYEAGWVEKNKVAPFVEGFVLYALDCLGDGRLFVWTASGTPNPSVQHPGEVYPAGDQVLDATRAEIERRSGQTFEDITSMQERWPWGAQLRAPTHVWRLRNVVLADYGTVYKHPEHATLVAPEVWTAIPAILASGPEPESSSPSSWWQELSPLARRALVFGALGALVGGGALIARRRTT